METLRRLGLINVGERPVFKPLTGGVSSDIHLVEAGGRFFCIKRALAQLKVATVWEAPLGRNAAEAAWLRTVGGWFPHAVPKVLAEDHKVGIFAMDYMPPDHYPVWKTRLLASEVDIAFATRVGKMLALIHGESALNDNIAQAFAYDDIFELIRLEPYLRATSRVHPDLADTLNCLADRTLTTKITLMHGDVSPKNILAGPQGPVFLDAECACYGDPAFDLAFCLNHLLLKGARRNVDRQVFLAAFRALSNAYLERVRWEEPAALEERAATLLPALFLARIDGRSPVEYLTNRDEKQAVRKCARALLTAPTTRLSTIADLWSRSP